jgi:hypothetical protein
MIEAMKQALEALEDFVDVIKYDNEQDDIGRRACCDVLSYNPHSESCKAKQAITAIKAALAQPAPVQEPVGYVAENGVVDWNVCVPPILTDLYTRQPQRTWVGLTDEEVTDLWHKTEPYYDEYDFAKAYEAKLKQKNGFAEEKNT